jgi:hypothetical protein
MSDPIGDEIYHVGNKADLPRAVCEKFNKMKGEGK